MAITVRNEAGEDRQVDPTKVQLAEADGFLPVVTNGKDQRRVSHSKLGAANTDGYHTLDAFAANKENEAKTEKDTKINPLVSAGLGVSDALTFGFGDEMVGAAKAIPNALTKGQSLGQAYTEARDEHRDTLKQAEEDNTGAYLAGNIGGGIASGIAGGIAKGGLTLAAKGAGFLQNAGLAAAEGMGYGALQGLGSSDAETAEGALKDTLTGTALGGALGGATSAVGSGIKTAVTHPFQAVNVAKNLMGKIGMSPAEKAALRNISPDEALALKGFSSADDIAGRRGLNQDVAVLSKDAEVARNAEIADLAQYGAEAQASLRNTQAANNAYRAGSTVETDLLANKQKGITEALQGQGENIDQGLVNLGNRIEADRRGVHVAAQNQFGQDIDTIVQSIPPEISIRDNTRQALLRHLDTVDSELGTAYNKDNGVLLKARGELSEAIGSLEGAETNEDALRILRDFRTNLITDPNIKSPATLASTRNTINDIHSSLIDEALPPEAATAFKEANQKYATAVDMMNAQKKFTTEAGNSGVRVRTENPVTDDVYTRTRTTDPTKVLAAFKTPETAGRVLGIPQEDVTRLRMVIQKARKGDSEALIRNTNFIGRLPPEVRTTVLDMVPNAQEAQRLDGLMRGMVSERKQFAANVARDRVPAVQLQGQQNVREANLAKYKKDASVTGFTEIRPTLEAAAVAEGPSRHYYDSEKIAEMKAIATPENSELLNKQFDFTGENVPGFQARGTANAVSSDQRRAPLLKNIPIIGNALDWAIGSGDASKMIQRKADVEGTRRIAVRNQSSLPVQAAERAITRTTVDEVTKSEEIPPAMKAELKLLKLRPNVNDSIVNDIAKKYNMSPEQVRSFLQK